MKFNYGGKGIDVSDSLRDRIEKKVGKLEKYFRDDVEAIVKLRLEKNSRNICEITLSSGGILVRAEENGSDMYQCIDRTADKLEKQIQRYRTKLEKRFRPQTEEPAPAEESAVEAPSFDIVRVKKFAMKPMAVEDAIAQMELLGHSFYMFKNADIDATCVLYRRNDGTYGLLTADE